MTISLEETLLEVRRQFRDVKWSNATLKAWIKDAVRDYSREFPVIGSVSDNAADDTYLYDFFSGAHSEEDLPVVFGVVEFEYPNDEDPPEYPERMDHTDEAFFDDGESYYDVVLHPSMNNGEVWLSEPETGDAFTIKYLTEHTWTSVDSGADENTEVPSHHRPIIVQYVIWQCYREMLTVEREEGDPLTVEMIEARLKDAREYYDQLIERNKIHRPAESGTVQWEMDKYDRIY